MVALGAHLVQQHVLKVAEGIPMSAQNATISNAQYVIITIKTLHAVRVLSLGMHRAPTHHATAHLLLFDKIHLIITVHAYGDMIGASLVPRRLMTIPHVLAAPQGLLRLNPLEIHINTVYLNSHQVLQQVHLFPSQPL